MEAGGAIQRDGPRRRHTCAQMSTPPSNTPPHACAACISGILRLSPPPSPHLALATGCRVGAQLRRQQARKHTREHAGHVRIEQRPAAAAAVAGGATHLAGARFHALTWQSSTGTLAAKGSGGRWSAAALATTHGPRSHPSLEQRSRQRDGVAAHLVVQLEDVESHGPAGQRGAARGPKHAAEARSKPQPTTHCLRASQPGRPSALLTRGPATHRRPRRWCRCRRARAA
jgi:hypothetical protein